MNLRKDGCVYEPAEDSWLLCATLEHAATRFPELHAAVLELGFSLLTANRGIWLRTIWYWLP